MCVHLVKKNGLEATVLAYEKSIPKSPQVYFSKKPSAHKAGRVPFTEVLRRKENDRLTGKAFNGSYVEEYRLSPQSGRKGIGRSCFTKKRCESRIENGLTHRSGHDDHYKDWRLRASGSGKTRAVTVTW